MVNVQFGRIIKLPVKLHQSVCYINDDGELMQGVIHSIDIYFLDSGKAVDIDFVVHPVVNGIELEIMESFSDFDFGKRIFRNEKQAKRILHIR